MARRLAKALLVTTMGGCSCAAASQSNAGFQPAWLLALGLLRRR